MSWRCEVTQDHNDIFDFCPLCVIDHLRTRLAIKGDSIKSTTGMLEHAVKRIVELEELIKQLEGKNDI